MSLTAGSEGGGYEYDCLMEYSADHRQGTLTTESARYFQTLVTIYQITRRHVQEDSKLYYRDVLSAGWTDHSVMSLISSLCPLFVRLVTY
jgi:hypothetical protein